MSIKRQTLWSMAPLAVVTVINLVSVPLFYRYLGPDRYALWFYVQTFGGAFGFMDLGFGVAVGRYIGVALGKGDHGAVREYWATGNAIAIPLLVAMSVVFVLLGVIFGPGWFNVKPEDVMMLRGSFMIAGLGLFLAYYIQFWNVLSQAYLDFKFISVLSSICNLSIIPTLLLAKWTANPVVMFAWGALVSVIQLLIFVWHARTRYGLGFGLRDARAARLHEMKAYTGKTFCALLVSSFMSSVDRLALGKLATSTVFSSYNIALNAGNRVQSLSVAIMGPVFHNTSRAIGSLQKASTAAIYDETFQFTFGWYCLLATWAFLWHPLILNLWLGPELGAIVAPLFSPVLLGCCLSAIANISGAQLGPLNRVGTGIFFNLATGVMLAIFATVGWKMAGVQGVAWGFLLSRFALILQDVFVIRLIGAGGWLCRKTWLQVLVQLLVAGCWYLVAKIQPASLVWQYACAILHGGIVASWLLFSSGIAKRFRQSSPSLPSFADSTNSLSADKTPL